MSEEMSMNYAINQMAKSSLAELLTGILIEMCKRGDIDQHAMPGLQMLSETVAASKDSMEEIVLRHLTLTANH